MRLEPFDLLFVHGAGRISDAIRWATGGLASHVSFVISGGELDNAVLQEALLETRRIVRRPLGSYRDTGDQLAIYRPLTLTACDLDAMRKRADATVGKRYGFANLGLQLVDAVLTKSCGRSVRFARKLAWDGSEICSQNTADVWQAAGLSFGVDPGTAAPVDILNFCGRHPDHYALLRDFASLSNIGCGVSPEPTAFDRRDGRPADTKQTGDVPVLDGAA